MLKYQTDGIPLPLATEKHLNERGFASKSHLVVGRMFSLNVGRQREISVGAIGTPNEMVFLNQKEDGGIIDLVCIHNYDYDGFLTVKKLDTIISIFK
jgi:hypothetical protein